MRLTRSSTGLLVRVGPGLLPYVLGFTALYPLWIALAEGGIARRQLPGALVVPAISLLLLVFFLEVAEFKFSPISRSLHWWKRGAFSRSEGTVALRDIEEVRLASRTNRDDRYSLHSVVITACGTTIPLSRALSTGTAGHRAVADAIVGYLAELGYHPRYVCEEPTST